MGLIRCLPKYSLYLIGLVVAIFYAPILKELNLKSRVTVLPKSFDGVWKENAILSKAEKLFVDELLGPESLAPYQGSLYTGLKGGRIAKVTEDKFEIVTHVTDKICTYPWEKKNCGRPIGTRVTSSGDLYTVDAYRGIVKVSLKDAKPKAQLIFPITTKVAGAASKFMENLAVVEEANGGRTIYITDASTVWDLDEEAILTMDQDHSGRVLKFEESTGKSSVVVGNLAFPNGVEVSDDKSFLLISEFADQRINRHYLKGPKAGKTEVILELPGKPDNIRRSTRKDLETYWIAVSDPRTAGNLTVIDRLSDKPHLRNFIIKTFYLVGSLLKKIGDTFNLKSFQSKGWELKTLSPLWDLGSHGMIIEIDGNGKVLACFHSPDGSINSLSEVREVEPEAGKRVLYLGSYSNDYLGRLKL